MECLADNILIFFSALIHVFGGEVEVYSADLLRIFVPQFSLVFCGLSLQRKGLINDCLHTLGGRGLE